MLTYKNNLGWLINYIQRFSRSVSIKFVGPRFVLAAWCEIYNGSRSWKNKKQYSEDWSFVDWSSSSAGYRKMFHVFFCLHLEFVCSLCFGHKRLDRESHSRRRWNFPARGQKPQRYTVSLSNRRDGQAGRNVMAGLSLWVRSRPSVKRRRRCLATEQKSHYTHFKERR